MDQESSVPLLSSLDTVTLRPFRPDAVWWQDHFRTLTFDHDEKEAGELRWFWQAVSVDGTPAAAPQLLPVGRNQALPGAPPGESVRPTPLDRKRTQGAEKTAWLSLAYGRLPSPDGILSLYKKKSDAVYLPLKHWRITQASSGLLAVVEAPLLTRTTPSLRLWTEFASHYYPLLDEEAQENEKEQKKKEEGEEGEMEEKENPKSIPTKDLFSKTQATSPMQARNEDLALPSGVYAIRPDGQSTPAVLSASLVQQWGFDPEQLAAATEYRGARAPHTKPDPSHVLPRISQLLLVPKLDDTRNDWRSPELEAVGGKTAFGVPFDLRLSNLEGDTLFQWFEGARPEIRAWRATVNSGGFARSRTRVPRRGGVFTLWAMQYRPERDRDGTGAPLVRWRRIQLMRAAAVPSPDVVVRQQAVPYGPNGQSLERTVTHSHEAHTYTVEDRLLLEAAGGGQVPRLPDAVPVPVLEHERGTGAKGGRPRQASPSECQPYRRAWLFRADDQEAYGPLPLAMSIRDRQPFSESVLSLLEQDPRAFSGVYQNQALLVESTSLLAKLMAKVESEPEDEGNPPISHQKAVERLDALEGTIAQTVETVLRQLADIPDDKQGWMAYVLASLLAPDGQGAPGDQNAPDGQGAPDDQDAQGRRKKLLGLGGILVASQHISRTIRLIRLLWQLHPDAETGTPSSGSLSSLQSKTLSSLEERVKRAKKTVEKEWSLLDKLPDATNWLPGLLQIAAMYAPMAVPALRQLEQSLSLTDAWPSSVLLLSSTLNKLAEGVATVQQREPLTYAQIEREFDTTSTALPSPTAMTLMLYVWAAFKRALRLPSRRFPPRLTPPLTRVLHLVHTGLAPARPASLDGPPPDAPWGSRVWLASRSSPSAYDDQEISYAGQLPDEVRALARDPLQRGSQPALPAIRKALAVAKANGRESAREALAALERSVSTFLQTAENQMAALAPGDRPPLPRGDWAQLPWADLERIARSLDLVYRLPPLRPRPSPSAYVAAANGRQSRISQHGGATGVWVDGPALAGSGPGAGPRPQVHDALTQVVERLKALRIVDVRAREGSIVPAEAEQIRTQLLTQPLRWSSLYVPLDGVILGQSASAIVRDVNGTVYSRSIPSYTPNVAQR